MIALILRVLNSLAQSKSQGIVVWARDSDGSVVLLEVIDLPDLLELLLEGILNLHWEAAEVLVDISIEITKLIVVAVLEHFCELKEGHRHVEACHSSLEADFTSVLFHDNLLAFVDFICMVELRDLANDPEGLPIKLLLEVNLKQISHVVFVADDDERQKVAQRGCEVLHALIFFGNKLLKLFMNLLLHSWAHFEQHREDAVEVYQSADSND